MGSAASSLWSPAEAEANEAALQRQQRASEFVIKHLFHDVPVRKAKKSADPRSPVWIEVHPSVMHDALTSSPSSSSVSDPLAIDAALLRTLPTGVLIDGKGGIRVVYSLHTPVELAYLLTVRDVATVEQAADLHTRGRLRDYMQPVPYSNTTALPTPQRDPSGLRAAFASGIAGLTASHASLPASKLQPAVLREPGTSGGSKKHEKHTPAPAPSPSPSPYPKSSLYLPAPAPLPPLLTHRTSDSLSLALPVLPQPPGIVQQVEIQYAHITTGNVAPYLGSGRYIVRPWSTKNLCTI